MAKELENKVLENSVLARFLGMEDMQDLRKQVKDVIVEQIRRDLKDSCYYILAPDDVNQLLGGIVEEACEEIKEEYKNQIKEVVAKKMAALNI